jgi:hypothetical protein
MLRRTVLRGGSIAAVLLLAAATLAPVGVTAGPPAGSRASADASPAPTTLPSAIGCPDISPGALTVATIVATGPAKMIECTSAAGVSTLTFSAYFPYAECTGCGGSRNASIDPGWLSGGLVDFDPATGAITPSVGISGYGMKVATGPEPDLIGDDAATTWTAANTLALRLPPGLGSCATDDTTADAGCTVRRYADQVLVFTAHYDDPAAATCAGSVGEGPEMPAAAVVAYCEQQLVVDAFVTTEPYVCPAAPYTVLDLTHYTTDRLVACLGSKKIVVTGYVPVPQSAGIGTMWAGKPGWLVDNGQVGMWVQGSGRIGGGVSMLVRIPPNLGACDITWANPSACPFTPFAGKTVSMVGRFVDPRSATCSASWASPAPKPAYFTRAYVRQYCREQFVLLSKPVIAKTPK